MPNKTFDEYTYTALISKHRYELMGFAALWIYCNHDWSLMFSGVPFIGFLESFLKRIGFCGVDIFLFLSGMGLYYSYNNRSLFSFYKNRMKRILFPILFTAVIRMILENWPLPEFLRNITGISFFFENIYAFLWFGIAIATLYLLFPVYAFFLSNNNKPVIFTIVFTIIWTLLSAAFGHIIREDLYGFLNRIPVFVIGACFSACAEKNVFLKINNRLIIYGFAALASGLILSYLTNYRKLVLLVPVSNCFIPNILITLSLCLFLPLIFMQMKRGSYLLRVFKYIGTISMELYCLQDIYVHNHGLMITHAHPLISNMLLFSETVILASMFYFINTAVWNKTETVFMKGTSK